MCKNTSQGIFMSYYLSEYYKQICFMRHHNIFFFCEVTYSIGLMILGMFSFVLVSGGRFSVTLPLTYPDPDQQMFNCMSVGVACYTISYNLFCEITMFRCRAKYPVLSTINMIATFAMIIALAMLFVYANVNLLALMGFCFIGATFGGLFVSNLREFVEVILICWLCAVAGYYDFP